MGPGWNWRAEGGLTKTAGVRWLIPGLLLLVASPAWARRAELPPQIAVAGKPLTLNGKATFRKWFFSIYDVGLYLERRTRSAQDVVGSEQLKRLHLRLLRDAPRDQMVNILRWRLQTVAGADYPKLEARVNTLLDAIPDAKSGANLYITWVPGRGTVFSGDDGRELVIDGKDFADALFNVWLQDKRVRPGLLGA